ncbi:hypothetical protein MYX76_10560 [Desulfobacterota bacterium AH_259_B03_O07]|nr:hypothetical protein [Desulfobacterota bacterium AH_259_B03_O07]
MIENKNTLEYKFACNIQASDLGSELSEGEKLEIIEYIYERDEWRIPPVERIIEALMAEDRSKV